MRLRGGFNRAAVGQSAGAPLTPPLRNAQNYRLACLEGAGWTPAIESAFGVVKRAGAVLYY